MRLRLLVGGLTFALTAVVLVVLVATVLSGVRGRASDDLPDDKHRTAIRVGPNVHVSQARAETEHTEVVIAADPKNAGRLLAGSMFVKPKGLGKFTVAALAYRSSDAGKTWEVAFEPETKKDTVDFGDPAVAYGPDGSAYYAAITRDGRGGPRLQLRRSRDGGKVWEEPTGTAEEIDRPFLAVDWTGGRFAGRLYCNCIDEGVRGGRPAVYTSADAGRSLGAPRVWAVKGRDFFTGQGVVLSDGTLVVPYRCLRSEKQGSTFAILVSRSTTGGETFLEEQSVWVDDYLGRDDLGRDVNFDPANYSFPMLAVDPGSKAFQDRLYVLWSQRTKAGRRVRLAMSQDKGATWSRPVLINEQPDADGAAHFDGVLAAVAVNRAGVVGVCWYEWRNTRSGEVRGHVYFRASVDGGVTWLTAVRVTDVAIPFWDKGSPEEANLGDTSGLAADAAGDFHPLWVDNRTGTRQVFTAAVRVKTP